MKVERLAQAPDWPGRMSAEVAALYMGISEGSFLTRFGSMGVKEGANKLWARVQLDRCIAAQFALPSPPAPIPAVAEDDTWDDVR